MRHTLSSQAAHTAGGVHRSFGQKVAGDVVFVHSAWLYWFVCFTATARAFVKMSLVDPSLSLGMERLQFCPMSVLGVRMHGVWLVVINVQRNAFRQ